MSSANVQRFRSMQESWNNRDFERLAEAAHESLIYTDHAQSRTLGNRREFVERARTWATICSDGKIVNPDYIDAGDVIIARYVIEGTNDGRVGELTATGRHVALPVCEIARFDADGKMISVDCYYNQHALLTQLGYAQTHVTAQ